MLSGVRTQGETAYQRLKADIMQGRLKSGDRLDLADLARCYQLSITPARDAAMRLTGERILAFDRRGGFALPNVSPSDLGGLLSAHRDLLLLALPKAAMKVEDREHVQTSRSEPCFEDYPNAVRAWSTSVGGMSENATLREMIVQLNDRLEPFRHHESRLIPSCAAELATLRAHFELAALRQLRAGIRAYHAKRIRHASQLLWIAGQST